MKEKKVPIHLMVTEKMKDAAIAEAISRETTLSGLIKQLLLPFASQNVENKEGEGGAKI